MDELIVDIVLEDVPATASLGGRKYLRYLPVGYLWELVDAYFYLDTSKAASTTNCNIWRLYDASGNTMATASGAGALTQANAMTLGSTTVINCATAASYVYATYVTSGAGETISEGVRVVATFRSRRPATAAGGYI